MSRADAPVYRVSTVGDFALKVSARENAASTQSLSAGATAADVAAAIMSLPAISCGAILVRRWDASSWADDTDISTRPTKFAYEIAFGNDRDADLAFAGDDAANDGVNVTQLAASGADAYAIAPAYREPSAPTNVILNSVSRSNLGATWSDPELDGGAPILKYLVEWDSDSDFSTHRDLATGFAGVDPATAGAVVVNATDSGAHSKRSDHAYQIGGLVAGRSYWARVSAYNDLFGYGDAASSAPAAARPADQLLGAPSKFVANLSSYEVANRLTLTFRDRKSVV